LRRERNKSEMASTSRGEQKSGQTTSAHSLVLPLTLDGSEPNRSVADFNWCMTAIDWRWSVEDTAAKLVEASEKARDRVRLKDKGYPLITAQNAGAAGERNRQKACRG